MLRLKSANLTLPMEIPNESETNLDCIRRNSVRPSSSETILYKKKYHPCNVKKIKHISSGRHFNAYQHSVLSSFWASGRLPFPDPRPLSGAID